MVLTREFRKILKATACGYGLFMASATAVALISWRNKTVEQANPAVQEAADLEYRLIELRSDIVVNSPEYRDTAARYDEILRNPATREAYASWAGYNDVGKGIGLLAIVGAVIGLGASAAAGLYLLNGKPCERNAADRARQIQEHVYPMR